MPGWPGGRRFLLGLLGLVVALSLGLISHPPGGKRPTADQGQGMGVVAGQVLPVPSDLRAPYPVQLALELQDLRGLELSSKTFKAQGLLRLEWGEPLQGRIRSGELDPQRLLHFVNQVEGWNSLLEPTGPVLAQPGGQRYGLNLRFEGLFYVNDFNFQRSPFLRVSLPLILEVADDRLALERQGVLLQPPQDAERLTGGGVAMAGFVQDGAAVHSALHRRENPLRPGQVQTLSRMVLQLDYRTEPVASLLKWILPLIVVMGVVLLAPSLDSGRDDLSFGLPSAGLLSLVVLQESYRNQMPDTPYLTFLDQLYAYSYLVAVGVFLLFLWGGNLRVRRADAPAAMAQINRVCGVVQLSSLLGYLVIVAWNWLV